MSNEQALRARLRQIGETLCDTELHDEDLERFGDELIRMANATPRWRLVSGGLEGCWHDGEPSEADVRQARDGGAVIEREASALTAHARPVDEAMVRRAFNAPLHSHNVAWIAFGYHNTPEPGTWQWDAMRAALEAALQPAQATPAAVDANVEETGPWSVCDVHSGELIDAGLLFAIDSDDFTHDARLYLSGDFATNEDARRYAEWLADRLTAAAAPHAQDTAPRVSSEMLADQRRVIEEMGDMQRQHRERMGRLDTAPRGGGAMWGANDLRRWANACKDKRGGVLIPDAVSGDVYDVLTWAADNLTAPPAAQASDTGRGEADAIYRGIEEWLDLYAGDLTDRADRELRGWMDKLAELTHKPMQASEGAEPDYVGIANRAQAATGYSIWPSTVKAILAAARATQEPT